MSTHICMDIDIDVGGDVAMAVSTKFGGPSKRFQIPFGLI